MERSSFILNGAIVGRRTEITVQLIDIVVALIPTEVSVESQWRNRMEWTIIIVHLAYGQDDDSGVPAIQRPEGILPVTIPYRGWISVRTRPFSLIK